MQATGPQAFKFADNLELAHGYAEAVEKIAKTLFLASQIGTPASLPAAELKGLRDFGSVKRRKAMEEVCRK